MTTITATVLPDLAAVLLEVSGAATGPVTLTRSDANGTHDVRLLPGQEPITGGMIVTDYEPALVGPVAYTLIDSAAVEDHTVVNLTGLVDHPVLVSPVRPQLRADLIAVTDYTHSRDTNATVHEIIDRQDPVVVYGQLRTRTGTVALYAPSFADAAAIENIFDSGEVVLLRQTDHDGMDQYLLAERTNVSVFRRDTTPRRWEVTVTFTQVLSPDAPLLAGAGWTFEDLPGQYPTFSWVTSAFNDFNALTVGP